MRGMIFIELLKMADEAFGEEAVDRILSGPEFPGKGVYTSVGNYSCDELVKLVMAFSSHSGLPPDTLQRKFGHWMLPHFVERYPEYFQDKTTAFEVLEAIDGEIHVQVRKLYPGAELPRFTTYREQGDQLVMIYSSPRPLAPFCQGMIEGCLEHYNQTANISSKPHDAIPGSVEFQIKLTA